MPRIQDLRAREVIDSRGDPTIEVYCVLEDGSLGRAAIPSGVSTGTYEALELRDGGTRLGGKGVLKAITHVKGPIREKLLRLEATNQAEIDRILCELDGTENKARLGANALLAVSLAASRAVADSLKLPLYRHLGGLRTPRLPLPLLNL